MESKVYHKDGDDIRVYQQSEVYLILLLNTKMPGHLTKAAKCKIMFLFDFDYKYSNDKLN